MKQCVGSITNIKLILGPDYMRQVSPEINLTKFVMSWDLIFLQIYSPNHRSSPVEKKAAVVFYYLKDTGSMTTTANIFGIHQYTLTQIAKKVCSAIVTYMFPMLVFAAVNDYFVDNFSAVID